MNNLYIKFLGLILFTSLVVFTACKDPLRTEYTEYNPTEVTKENVKLTYVPNVDYPSFVVHKTDTPTFIIDGAYKFNLDTIKSTTEGGFKLGNFDIDSEFGVISYNNKDGALLPGKVQVSVSVTNVTGVVVFDDVMEFEVLEVPILLAIDNSTVEAGVLQQGVLATVSYTDESPDQSISSVEYSLNPEVLGFSIDASTGEISKTTEAITGEHVLSVAAKTNLGLKSFSSITTVTVGPPPTISYKQSNGVDDLNKVTVSPWSAYSSQAPELQDMVATQWDIILPEGLASSAFSAGDNGEIIIAENQNLPIGDFIIGVKATNASGTSFDFNDLLTIHVETRWETTPIIDEDFQDDAGNVEFGSFESYYLADAVYQGVFEPNHQKFDDAGKPKQYDIRLAKFKSAKNTDYSDAVLVLPIDLTIVTGVKDLRVAFGEGVLIANSAVYERTLAFTYDGFAGDGSSIPADWTVIMDNTNSDWQSKNWGKGFYYNDYEDGYPTTVVPDALEYFPQTSYHELGGVDGTKTINICWRVAGTNTNKFQNFLFDDIKVQASIAFPAEEN